MVLESQYLWTRVHSSITMHIGTHYFISKLLSIRVADVDFWAVASRLLSHNSLPLSSEAASQAFNAELSRDFNVNIYFFQLDLKVQLSCSSNFNFTLLVCGKLPAQETFKHRTSRKMKGVQGNSRELQVKLTAIYLRCFMSCLTFASTKL